MSRSEVVKYLPAVQGFGWNCFDKALQKLQNLRIRLRRQISHLDVKGFDGVLDAHNIAIQKVGISVKTIDDNHQQGRVYRKTRLRVFTRLHNSSRVHSMKLMSMKRLELRMLS